MYCVEGSQRIEWDFFSLRGQLELRSKRKFKITSQKCPWPLTGTSAYWHCVNSDLMEIPQVAQACFACTS